ncbi:MAG: hypothetical protein DWQ01_04450 [Planctomycetota bacterium]|nr:MAG: hypothetical protein DWQ01_04450 [Planctomycetota bacterium]
MALPSLVVWGLCLLQAPALPSQEVQEPPNLPMKTLGGKQFWQDVFVFQGWRIQKHHYLGHCRLLDPKDVRRAWGRMAACEAAFARIREEKKLRRRSDHLVVLLHGLGRSKDSMKAMREMLVREGYEVAAINYPSTRRSIGEHAAQIEEVLWRSPDIHQVSFVTHSLGGIVVRTLLARNGPWKQRMQARRVVMLAPPNRGSFAAERLKDFIPFRLVMGESGARLDPSSLVDLPEPNIAFGIIAGGTGDPKGYNPLLPGDDDGVVCVANTRLAGAADFLLVHASHTFIMNRPEVLRATANFLQHGNFSAPPPPASR